MAVTRPNPAQALQMISIAALANAAGAAAAHARLLNGRGRAAVVNRKAFSEIH